MTNVERLHAPAFPSKMRARVHQTRRKMVTSNTAGINTDEAPAMKPEGLTVHPSRFDPKETMERAVAAVTERGMNIFGRVDHATAAVKADLDLRPTDVLIFGNPVAGTPLMQAAQTIGIDLPLKILVWQDAAGKTWLGYNDPRWLLHRHGLGAERERALAAMTRGLAAIAEAATM